MAGTARAWTVGVTGASGLVGSALVTGLTSAGHRVVRVVRGAGAASVAGQRLARWDPESGALEPSALAGADAVVHLAGESVAGGRWTEAKKRRIRSSRVDVTRRLAEALPRLERPPRLLVSASAVGYYGDRGSEILREDSAPGPGFLAEVCREWEAATDPAARAGIRVVRLRIGMVLSRRGGALGAMLTPFRLGAGGPVGRGAQWVSWISIDDLVGAILHALATESLAGPVNAAPPSFRSPPSRRVSSSARWRTSSSWRARASSPRGSGPPASRSATRGSRTRYATSSGGRTGRALPDGAPWVERIAQAVADHVEREDGEHDRGAGEERHPGCLRQKLFALVQDRAPRGCGRLDPEPEIRERGLDQDAVGEADRRLDHDR